MRTLLVAGLTGQLGRGFLAAAPPDVRVLGLDRRGQGRLLATGLGAEDVLLGDVTRPLWGLERELGRLGDVDAVVNLAGQTDWAARGSDLYLANVEGCRAGLALARRLRRPGHRVAYCYASTVYVAGGALGSVPEAPLPVDRHRTAYEQSKWVAETHLRAAGDDEVLIARFPALLGDSSTGSTVRRNSLYQLADRLPDLPGRVLPAMAQARVDALARDVAAAALHAALRAFGTRQRAGTCTVHIAAGGEAPTLRELIAVGRRLGANALHPAPRLLAVGPEPVLWLTQNPDRFARPGSRWKNALTGLRYVALEREYERTALADLVGSDQLPVLGPEALARLLFDPPVVPQVPGGSDRALARFHG